jgi:hypothetical protein
MRQTREHVGLAREILDRFFLLDSVADDHLLDRDRTVGEARVVGQVYATHPADAEHFFHAVSAIEKMALGELLTRIHDDFLQPPFNFRARGVLPCATGGDNGSRDRFYHQL